ncbi:MAG TPA: class I SAM-dependent methyltransferase [Acidimicrobiales bacterium]|nr:class I SAM-dependent methyltransferase [Acidimicrobiales bacterium]
MGFYGDQVLPRVIDVMLGGDKLGELRARAMQGLTGEVLEIGFGSGTNVPWYPPEVTRVIAVDPATVGRKLAAKRLAASPVPVEFAGLDGDRIDLPGASMDSALSTFTLCTVPDEVATLREIARILRPGGRLFFLEHGRSDDARVAARQERLDGVQQRIAGGCHLTRDHTSMLEEAGYVDIECTNFTIAGLATMSYLYAGSARRRESVATD